MRTVHDDYDPGPLSERLGRSRRQDPIMFWSMIVLSLCAIVCLGCAGYLTTTTPYPTSFERLP